jgi:hypothetical protein
MLCRLFVALGGLNHTRSVPNNFTYQESVTEFPRIVLLTLLSLL